MHFIHIFLTANNVKQISINHLSCTYNSFNTPICVIVVRAAAVFIFNAIQKIYACTSMGKWKKI